MSRRLGDRSKNKRKGGRPPSKKAEPSHDRRRASATLQNYMKRESGDSILVPHQPASSADEQSLSGAFVGSESFKHTMTEISSYNILLAAAESVGDNETPLFAIRSVARKKR